jgi:hypothetical protein
MQNLPNNLLHPGKQDHFMAEMSRCPIVPVQYLGHTLGMRDLRAIIAGICEKRRWDRASGAFRICWEFKDGRTASQSGNFR